MPCPVANLHPFMRKRFCPNHVCIECDVAEVSHNPSNLNPLARPWRTTSQGYIKGFCRFCRKETRNPNATAHIACKDKADAEEHRPLSRPPPIITRREIGDEPEKCSICLDVCDPSECQYLRLACGHEFHEDCLAPWIRNEKTCPMCREEIVFLHVSDDSESDFEW